MTGGTGERGSGFVEPEVYYAQLATWNAAAGALITDPAGRVLLVDPNYRDYWLLPGGMVDDDEPPEAACARELKEELGLDLEVGRLLVVDWSPAHGERPRPIAYFLFDAGTISDPSTIRLQADELDAYAFVDLDEAITRLTSALAARLPVALSAREAGTTVYLPQIGT